MAAIGFGTLLWSALGSESGCCWLRCLVCASFAIPGFILNQCFTNCFTTATFGLLQVVGLECLVFFHVCPVDPTSGCHCLPWFFWPRALEMLWGRCWLGQRWKLYAGPGSGTQGLRMGVWVGEWASWGSWWLRASSLFGLPARCPVPCVLLALWPAHD